MIGQTGPAGLPKKTGRQVYACMRLHCSLLPMKALTYRGAGPDRGRFPSRKRSRMRSDSGVWQPWIAPKRGPARKPAAAVTSTEVIATSSLASRRCKVFRRMRPRGAPAGTGKAEISGDAFPAGYAYAPHKSCLGAKQQRAAVGHCRPLLFPAPDSSPPFPLASVVSWRISSSPR